MKKALKFVLVGIILFSLVGFTSNFSFAVDEEADIESMFQDAEDIEEEKEEEATTQENNTQSEEQETTQNENNKSEEQQSQATSQEETKTTTVPETKTEEVKNAEEVEETKLPQTGEAENYFMIIAAIACAGLAVFAYKKAKKYNV